MTHNCNINNETGSTSMLDFYIVQRTLGSGSTSKVKLVQDPFSNTLYAAKIIKLLPQFSPYYYRSLLLSEVACLRKVTHKNVIRIFSYRELGSYTSKSKGFYKCMYIILEYCLHGDLFSLLEANKNLNEDVSLLFFRQIIDALEACHKSGFAHGDLKPENILISDDGIKIIDFALCTKIAQQDRKCIGTHQYLPPECRIKQNIDVIKSDLFLAGVVLFIMYVGCPPFQCTDSEDALYSMIKMGEKERFWDFFERRRPDKFFSQDFKILIEGLLEFDPNKRMGYEQIKKNFWFQQNIDEEAVIQFFTQKTQ